MKTTKLGKLKKNSGFSLLEMLVAFSIFSLSIGVLLRIFSLGVTTASVAEHYTVAVQIAESLLAETGTTEKLKLGEQQGQKNDYYHWKIKIIPAKLDINAELAESVTIIPVQIDVMVSWQTRHEKSRTVQLTTIKLMPKTR